MKKLNFKMTRLQWGKVLWKSIPNGEIRITLYPFHSGIRVEKIIRCKVRKDIHCKNIYQVIKTVKELNND